MNKKEPFIHFNELESKWTFDYNQMKFGYNSVQTISPDGKYLAVQNLNELRTHIFAIETRELLFILFKRRYIYHHNFSFSKNSEFLIEQCAHQILIYSLSKPRNYPIEIDIGRDAEFLFTENQQLLLYKGCYLAIYNLTDGSKIASYMPQVLRSFYTKASISALYCFTKSTLILSMCLEFKFYYFLINWTGKVVNNLFNCHFSRKNQIKFKLPFYYRNDFNKTKIYSVFKWKKIKSVENYNDHSIIPIIDKDLKFIILSDRHGCLNGIPIKQISCFSNQVHIIDFQNKFGILQGQQIYPNSHMILNQDRGKFDILKFKTQL